MTRHYCVTVIKEDLMELLTRIQHLSKENRLLFEYKEDQDHGSGQEQLEQMTPSSFSMGKSWKR